MSGSNSQPPTLLQTWAQQTLTVGAAGTVYGALKGFVNSQPAHFIAAAYGVNTALFAGAFLGTRSVLLATLPSEATADVRLVSAGAGAAVGLVASGFHAGLKKAPLGAALWAAVGYAGQDGLNRIEQWRQREAAAIKRSSGQVVEPVATAAAPPAAAAVSATVPRSSAAASSSGVAASTASGAASSGDADWQSFWTWLPLSLSSDGSDAKRLKKLRTRQREIEEMLGQHVPEQDPRVADLRRREAQASSAAAVK